MARLRCLMMQRNQTSMLDAWLRYHGYLFGLENLTVLDNGSTDPVTVDILRCYERAGSTVSWRYRTEEDFLARHARLGSIIGGWEPERYDFAIGLECDEFITVFTESGLSCRRDEIDAHLDTLVGTGRHDIGLALRGVPEAPGFYATEAISRALASPDASTQAPRSTELTLVIATCREARRHGSDEVLVGLPDLAVLADALGIEDAPFGALGEPATAGHSILARRGRPAAVFDGRAYLDLNPDVAAAGWPPLKHFILRGFSEKRRLAPKAKRVVPSRTAPKASRDGVLRTTPSEHIP